MCDAAVHRLLDGRTQGTCVRAPVNVRPQNSHVVKLERCAKLTNLSDLRRADRGGDRRWSNSSLQVIDPKASAAPSWSGMMAATIPRSMSDPFDGQCMLTAVLRRCSSVRQVTAVEGDTPSKVHDVTKTS